MSAMIEEREKQFQSFIHNILLYQKELLSQEYVRITLIMLGFEFDDVAYSFSLDPVSLYHGKKSDIMMQSANVPASHHLHAKYKSVIILEMSSIITAKHFSLPDYISSFNDLAVADLDISSLLRS